MPVLLLILLFRIPTAMERLEECGYSVLPVVSKTFLQLDSIIASVGYRTFLPLACFLTWRYHLTAINVS